MKYFYGVLSLFGLLVPYGVFVPWLAENGLDLGLLLSEAASTRAGAFAWADVIISAVVVIAFILVEGSRRKMQRLWLPILGTCTVGVSFGLPLFLLQRELHVEQRP